MSELTDWVRQQIALDRLCAEHAGGERWIRNGATSEVIAMMPHGRGYRIDALYAEGRDHIATFDPARMLVEMDVKLALLDEAERQLADDATDETARWTTSMLAMPYADRPGYRNDDRAAR